jgi:Lon protease-like protein
MQMESEIAIFPLSNVVLFPLVQTPLYVFEPRYVQMAEHVLASSRCVGMVVVPPEHCDELPGDPPIYPVGCAGEIAQAQRLPDGRYNLVLFGVQRFRISSEWPPEGERLFRMAEVEPLDDPYPDAERRRVRDLRERIVALLGRLVRLTNPERAEEISLELFGDTDDATFVNSLCTALSFTPPEKQGLLEAHGIPARFARLEGLLSFRMAELSTPGRHRPGLVH